MIRKARAVWRGSGRAGNGDLSSDSGVLANTPYSFRTRFENEKGTNPEELIAAAHAGCFTMALAFRLQGAGVHPYGAQYRGSRHPRTGQGGLPYQSLRPDPARGRTESGSGNVRSVGAGRRAELPGFQGAQVRDYTGREAGLNVDPSIPLLT